MTKTANIESIEKTTGKPWKEWVAYLENINANELPHKEIAQHVHQQLQGIVENAGWWAQGITVAYEQHTGRRLPGQRSDGTFEVAASKTVNATMDETIDKWLTLVKNKHEFDTVQVAQPPTTSRADKSRHWSCNLSDGTRINADTYPKSAEKTVFTITHIRLDSPESAAKWRAYWKTTLEKM